MGTKARCGADHLVYLSFGSTMTTAAPHTRLKILTLLTGSLQGLLLWWLAEDREAGDWLYAAPVTYLAIFYFAMAAPFAIYCTHGIAGLTGSRRWIGVAAFGALYACLGGYSAWSLGAQTAAESFSSGSAVAATVLGFVGLSLLCGFDFAARRWNYARLFEYTWRNGILLFTAAAMSGSAWVVLWAGASLMELIGIKAVIVAIKTPLFVYVVTGILFASAFALALTRASLAESIRRFWLSTFSWLLPLVLLFGVMWALTILATGLDALFRTHKAALIMFVFMALAVKFANCAYQDGQIPWPYPRWLGRSTQAAWLSLLVVAAVAWWALGLRVGQHGWSESRLWAALISAVVAVYAVGYSLSWLRRDRWMACIANTNIVAALMLCVGLTAFLTPLADIKQLAVSLHVQHVADAKGSIEPDWKYLRWNSGRFGREALQKMASGDGVPQGFPWATTAAARLANNSRFNDANSVFSEALLREKFPVFPIGRVLPEPFVQLLKTENQSWLLQLCMAPGHNCAIWMGNLNNDGEDEIVVFIDQKQTDVRVFRQIDNSWRAAGLMSPDDMPAATDFSHLESVQPAAPEWKDLLVGGKRFRLHLHHP